ncbi:agmatine deiminase family protein [Haloferula sp.]|uniref:agmatine deiminase family protein n=1 Tax=Haloferula sp. TaxID=2497595 RepID=UPI0032A09E05
MTPASLGFSMPPEWAPQDAVWLSWPVDDPRHWGGDKQALIHNRFAELTAAISRFQTARINAPASSHEEIRRLCKLAKVVPEHLELFDHPHDDVWCRDHGPIFVKNTGSGEIALTDWEFNAWGGKFEPWNRDNSIPAQVAESLSIRRFENPMILEGGAIEINSVGQILTTEAVLLNPNRNPHLNREEIEQQLCDYLGAKEVLWLERGIEGDDTDGHIDDLARFTDDDTIVAGVESDTNSPNHKVLSDNLRRLSEFKTPTARPFNLVEMPMPEACEIPGWRLPILPASYVNFLIINGAVLVPTFRQARNDDRACGILRELFPKREVVGVDALDFVEEGGTLHCLSQQQPV